MRFKGKYPSQNWSLFWFIWLSPGYLQLVSSSPSLCISVIGTTIHLVTGNRSNRETDKCLQSAYSQTLGYRREWGRTQTYPHGTLTLRGETCLLVILPLNMLLCSSLLSISNAIVRVLLSLSRLLQYILAGLRSSWILPSNLFSKGIFVEFKSDHIIAQFKMANGCLFANAIKSKLLVLYNE